MVWFLYIVAFLFIAKGSFLVLYTEKAQELSAALLERDDRRLWGIAGSTFGVLLAIASFWSGVVWFLFVLGLLITGISLFLLFAEQQKVEPLLKAWGSVTSTRRSKELCRCDSMRGPSSTQLPFG